MGNPRIPASFALLFALSLSASCAHPGARGERLLARNQAALDGLTPGMSRAEVVRRFETRVVFVREAGRRVRVANPHRTLSIEIDPTSRAEALFYYVRTRTPDGVVTDDELGAVVFEEGRLVGVGRDWIERRYAPEAVREAERRAIELELAQRSARRARSLDPVEESFRDAVARGNYLFRLGQSLSGMR